jgi:hypothetical protein
MSDSVEFRHLEYLVAIHEGKNFTKAAERVYRSQPAISQQIRALEEDVGFPIFVRGGKDGVSPTPAGELVLNWARTVLLERRQIFVIAKAIYKGEVPPLKLGFSPFINPRLLQSIRDMYNVLFPGCEIQLSSGDQRHTLERIELGSLDCALLPLPVNFSNPGQHVLVAHYLGNSTYPAADSDSYSYTIQNVGTQHVVPSLTMSATSFTTGENSHISIHHDCNSACGLISLTIDNNFYIALQLDANGNASVDTFWWWTQWFTVGHHTMVAQYLGNSTYAPENSSAKDFDIQLIGNQPTTVSLSIPSSFNPATATPVTVHVDCNSACGIIQLTVDGSEWRNWALDSNGTLSLDTYHWPTPLLTPGNHTVKAHFYGNATYAAKDSDPSSVNVTQ